MTVTQNTQGQLSQEQRDKLKELWSLVLELLDPIHNHNSNLETTGSAYTPKLVELLHQKTNPGRSELKTLRNEVNDLSPDTLFVYLLNTTKQESPDRFLLRFLKARKWDVGKSFAMLVHALVWRNKLLNVDETVVSNTELNALKESHDTSDPQKAKMSHGFLEQLRTGKCFLHGTDRIGRPILVLQGRLHRSTEKNEVLNRGILHMIEAARLVLVPPVESVTAVFDMTGFSVSNMEYAAAKFLIECSQTGYPEFLGVLLIHNAPWAFSGIWKTMKRWIEPEIASRIHFTYTTAEIEKFIAPERLVQELKGKENWSFEFVEPIEGENAKMEDTATRDAIYAERRSIGTELLSATSEWLKAETEEERGRANSRREDAIVNLHLNYWTLDPYVRGRNLLDRTGVIQEGGKIDFYPNPNSKSQ
ncbi:hypothetical protein N7474_008639 [Penicillium riverlandense]|uniref:uncharacterized protein n=1 Tax=Penicillium riverlandense TaxID=1903569 RepID=UPI002548C68D|nr:uncharacterized protein N7474_008639 [Penicillium riverlandense]KAJ5812338.1 hypothetical protein N7474_008639 [Penicillium riverlandense]